MKRRGFGIFLMICLVAPFMVTYTALHIQRRQVRRTVKRQIIAGISMDELVKLEFDDEQLKTDLNWKHDHEFEYKGQMYDIVKRSSENGKTSFWCWWDSDETKLSKQLSSLLSDVLNGHPARRNHKQKLFSFLKLLFYESTEQQVVYSDLALQGITAYEWNVKTFELVPPSPPPRFI